MSRKNVFMGFILLVVVIILWRNSNENKQDKEEILTRGEPLKKTLDKSESQESLNLSTETTKNGVLEKNEEMEWLLQGFQSLSKTNELRTSDQTALHHTPKMLLKDAEFLAEVEQKLKNNIFTKSEIYKLSFQCILNSEILVGVRVLCFKLQKRFGGTFNESDLSSDVEKLLRE